MIINIDDHHHDDSAPALLRYPDGSTVAPPWLRGSGGFGAAALGFPNTVLGAVEAYLRKRIRNSNVDVLVSKGISRSWRAQHDSPVAAEHFAAGRCAYKPRAMAVLHRGGATSNFGSAHEENSRLRCGVGDGRKFFTAIFDAPRSNAAAQDART